MKNTVFQIDFNDETGRIRSIVFQKDEYQMNWCGQTHEWGEIFFRNEPHAYDASKGTYVINTWNFQEENKLIYFEESESEAVSVYSNGRLQNLPSPFHGNGRRRFAFY